MARLGTFFVVLVFLIAASPLAGSAGARDWSVAEEEIWALEREYHARLAKGDVEGLTELWHEDFLGWPSHSPGPVDLSGTRASVAELLAAMEIVSSEVRPLAVTLWGDVALVHYEASLVIDTSEGKRASVSYRLTHTWIKDGGSWRVLGGMSSQRPPDAPE